MQITVRIRQELARRPWLHWLLVAALAATAAGAARAVVVRADAERQRWGTVADVLVATADVAPGDLLTTAVEQRQLPVAMIPPGAVRDVDSGQLARQHVSVGEVVTEVDVAPGAGPQSLVPPGHVAVPVDEAVASGAAIGDRVMVAADGIELARGVVVAAGETPVVAVPARDGPTVAAAAAGGSVMLLLEP